MRNRRKKTIDKNDDSISIKRLKREIVFKYSYDNKKNFFRKYIIQDDMIHQYFTETPSFVKYHFQFR